jgi:hypothetical protein
MTGGFHTAKEALVAMREQGGGRFQYREGDGSLREISLDERKGWVREDGKTLEEIQDEIDRDNLRQIEKRAALREKAGQLWAEEDLQMAQADIQAFLGIKERHWQESAAVEMAANTRQYPEYKAALDKLGGTDSCASYCGVAQMVYMFDERNEQKVWEKEEQIQKWLAATSQDEMAMGDYPVEEETSEWGFGHGL